MTISHEIAHHVGETAVLREGDVLEATPGPDADFSMAEISEAYMIPLEDYNQMEGEPGDPGRGGGSGLRFPGELGGRYSWDRREDL